MNNVDEAWEAWKQARDELLRMWAADGPCVGSDELQAEIAAVRAYAAACVAEALAQKEARIAELVDDLDSKQQSVQSLFELAQARSIRIAELEAALRPWAALEKEVRLAKGAALYRQKDEWELAPYLWELWESGCVCWWPVKIGDLRRADAALKGGEA